jgi:hypothetical protein
LISASGGFGGQSGSNAGLDQGIAAVGGNGGVGSLGDINAAGQAGFGGYNIDEDASEYAFAVSGAGGQSYFQMGAPQIGLYFNFPSNATSSAGIQGFSNGAGGSGAAALLGVGAIGATGGAGANGCVTIVEYI